MLNKPFDFRSLNPKNNAHSPAPSCYGSKKSESITCPTCGNKITELVSLRCPRCFAPLIKAGGCSGNCAKCGTHSF